MKLSVIILNYKVPYHLLLCLQSVQKSVQHLDAEIIVVDNCSEDESAQLVKKYFQEVILLENKTNEGFSKGNNRGVEIAHGEYICLLNPDTVVAENTFENILKFAENHPDFGAIGLKMIDGTGNFLPESKRNLPVPKVAFQKLLGNTQNYYAHHLVESENGKVDVLAGAFMFMKKSRYLEVGGLDNDYFMYGEDIDLCYKFSKSGYQNYYIGTETMLHYKGESTVKNAEYAERFYGAMRLFYQKHFRSNRGVDMLVKYGLELAKFSSRFRSKKRQSPPSKFKEVYWVSENNQDFLGKMKKTFETEIVLLSPTHLQNQKIENAILVFDSESVPHQRIFQVMEERKNRKNAFQIKSAKRDFFIGSDSSDHKGEVRFF